jgi:hypothetical protein
VADFCGNATIRASLHRAEIDLAPADYAPFTAHARRLLYKLALLEYNSFWWRSHPVVRTLNGYDEAVRAMANAD